MDKYIHDALPVRYSRPAPISDVEITNTRIAKIKVGEGGREFRLLGRSEKEYDTGQRLWHGARALAKTILTLGTGLFIDKTKTLSDWTACFTGKKTVTIYSDDLPFQLDMFKKTHNSSALVDLGLNYEAGEGVEKSYEKAVELYLLAANDGNSQAQYILGRIYEEGRVYGDGRVGIEKSDNLAAAHYYMAADYTKSSNPEAQFKLGRMYEEGRVHELIKNLKMLYPKHTGLRIHQEERAKLKLPEDQRREKSNIEEAEYYYGQAANRGHTVARLNLARVYESKGELNQAFRLYIMSANPLGVNNAEAQFHLGRMYESGQGVEQQSDVMAARYYHLAANQGNAEAQVNLGSMHVIGQGVGKSDEEAIRYFRLAADQGNVLGQANLGLMYANGQGVEQSYEEAAKLFVLAADQGHAMAQANLGTMYANGQVVGKSDEEAVKYFRLAADQGNAEAQANLGIMYMFGRGGLERSNIKAAEYLSLAANQGNASAQVNLGSIYANGQFYEKSFELYRMAADQGNATAQANLGIMYENGQGVDRDVLEAAKYYRLAAAQGFAEAEKNLKRLEANGLIT